MAGIGFELRRLAEKDTISAVASAAGHAAVIAAGPWLFTILSLAAISFGASDIVPAETVATFRAVIIYAFAASLVLTAPITIVATRLVADRLWLKKPEEVKPLLFSAYAAALAVVAPVSLLLVVIFSVPIKLAAALMAASLITALIWVAVAFTGAVRDYAGVTGSFAFGLTVGVVASLGAVVMKLGATGMVIGLVAGLTLTFFGLTFRVLATFPEPLTDIYAGLQNLWEGLKRYWHLAAGALAGTAGVWIDKWVFWLSPEAESTSAGLVHAPLYDSSMFIASLAIIPALAAFVIRLETDFFDRFQNYYGIIKSHGTLRQIETSRAKLERYSLDQLVLIAVAQIGICAVLILSTPAIAEFLNLQFRQIAILRYGALATVFLFIYIAATAMLLFFDRRRLYLWLQVLFLALNGLLTLATLSLGDDFYGVGFFLACLIASAVAFIAAERTFVTLNYLTFIGNNPSVIETATARSSTGWHAWLFGARPRNAQQDASLMPQDWVR